MKLYLSVAISSALFVTATCSAITLKLDPQIDLLVLDGRKISGSLLKGADSLELESGQHQFLFRVEQSADPQRTNVVSYQSRPMIVTFTSLARSITIKLPALDNQHERHQFDQTLNFQLIDEHGVVITSRRDRLPDDEPDDVEKAMLEYNRDGKIASVPDFATKTTTAAVSAQLTTDLALVPQSEMTPFQRWFHRFDEVTRQRFIDWVKMLRTS